MSVSLSDEQHAYMKAIGKVILNACPGSGKTTSVAHKLHFLIQNWKVNYNKTSGIACLSFTNVAKNEIAEKYKEISGSSLPSPHTILTIDSFVNSYITLPFAHKVKDVGKRYRIIDDMDHLRNILKSNWNLSRSFGSIIHRFDPSKIDLTANGGFAWDGHDKSDDSEFVKYAQAVKKAQIELGLLKTSDSAFLALNILKKYPRLAKYIAHKFPHLIIDEAQDTSELQHSILEILYNEGLKNIDLVGDPYQCLYQWRNASPQLFLEKFDDKEKWNGIHLTENRRSTKKIIDAFAVLRRNGEKSVVAINNSSSDLPVHVIKCNVSDYSAAIRKYEELCRAHNQECNNIIVRGNTLRNLLLGTDSDFSPWSNSIPYLLINSKIHLQSNEIKEAIRHARRITIELSNPDISFSDRKEKENETKNDKKFNGLIFNLIRDLPSFDLTIKEWTIQSQAYLKKALELVNEPDFGIRKKNTKTFDKGTLENQVAKYFKKSTTDNNIPVTTIHQVKGMTFDSVFLILSSSSTGQNISLNDFVRAEEMPSEKQRLIYVAMSRPRTLLCVGVPDTVTDEVIREKFGIEVLIL